MALKTPPLHARGIYQLAEPWEASPTILYQCIAIRSFPDFVEKGQDVFSLFYQPKGLDEEAYQADRLAGANIITLASGSLPMIHVPDSYIESYPILGSSPYKSIVLSVALGPLPNDTSLDFLKDQVSGVVSDVIGVDSTVMEHAVANSDVITPEQAVTLEIARQAAISARVTDRAKLLQAQNDLAAAQQRITILEQIIIDNDLLPPSP